jgi:3-hydroxyacyl-[acyl-carrier-protein] dehydratase
MRFVLIDRLLALEPGKEAVAVMSFSEQDGFFTDHFPGFSVVPGVLLTEALGQTGGWLLVASLSLGRWPLLTMIERAKFRRLVLPGDEIVLRATIRSAHRDDFEVDGEARVRGERVAGARLLFHVFDFALPAPDARQFAAWARETFRRLGGEGLLGRPVLVGERND